MIRRALLLMGFLALAAGCGSNSYDLSLASSPPGGVVEVSNGGVRLAEGLAILVAVDVGSDSADDMLLVSDDPKVIDVYPSTNEDEFVVIAHSIGRTTLRVQVGGEDVRTVSAQVVAQ